MISSSQDLARRTAVLAQLHIVEQEQRIGRQQKLVADSNELAIRRWLRTRATC
jgi:hypothetical protein